MRSGPAADGRRNMLRLAREARSHPLNLSEAIEPRQAPARVGPCSSEMSANETGGRGSSWEPSGRREAWNVGGVTTASRGMTLYSKIHEDITLRSQAERQREGKFRYRRVRVFGGNLLWSGLPRLFAFFFSSSPWKDKTKEQEWIERILRLCHVYFANKSTGLKS